MRGNVHVRFGRRLGETDRPKGRNRAPDRPKLPDPGAGSLGTDPAADARGARTAHPRLRSQRNHQPVCRARCRLRASDRRHESSSSRRGVPPLPEPDGRGGAGAPPGPRRAGQLLDAQDPIDPAVAGPPSSIHSAFHPDLQLVAEPRRALVRRTDHQVDQTLSPPLRQRPRRLAAHLDHQLERRPKPYVWHKTADDILDSLAHYCQRINDSGH